MTKHRAHYTAPVTYVTLVFTFAIK